MNSLDLDADTYVARGVLHANLSNFEKAIDDLRTAIQLNPKHVNARMYLGETLMVYARTLESENKLEEAITYYNEYAQVISVSSDTFDSLTVNKIDTDFDVEKSATNSSSSKSNGSSSSGSSSDDKCYSSSDSDSDNSSFSGCSSDELSSNKSQKLEKERSMSPLSRRMAIMELNSTNGGELPCNPSFSAAENFQSQQLNTEQENDLVTRIQNLLISNKNKGKKHKPIEFRLKQLLKVAYALQKKDKKTGEKIKKNKFKNKNRKQKKVFKNKQKDDNDHNYHKQIKSKKHKFTEQSVKNEKQVSQKFCPPDPKSNKSKLSNSNETIYLEENFKSDKPNDKNVIDNSNETIYLEENFKSDKPNDKNVIDNSNETIYLEENFKSDIPNDENVIDTKENERSDMFETNENIEQPVIYKYDMKIPLLISIPSGEIQRNTITTTSVRPEEKEPTEPQLYNNWGKNSLDSNQESVRNQTLSVSENSGKFQQKQSRPILSDKDITRIRSLRMRRITYSRTRSSKTWTSLKKTYKTASKSKSRSRLGSCPRYGRRNSLSRYHSSLRSHSRSSLRSRSRSSLRSRSRSRSSLRSRSRSSLRSRSRSSLRSRSRSSLRSRSRSSLRSRSRSSLRSRSRSSLRSRSRSSLRSRSRSTHHCNRKSDYDNRSQATRYYKPRFRNHHDRSLQHSEHRQNYKNNSNNWNNRDQRAGRGPFSAHYEPKQYDRNRRYEKRSYSSARSRSRSRSRPETRRGFLERQNRKRLSGSGAENQQHVAINEPKTPPKVTTEIEFQNYSTDHNANGN